MMENIFLKKGGIENDGEYNFLYIHKYILSIIFYTSFTKIYIFSIIFYTSSLKKYILSIYPTSFS